MEQWVILRAVVRLGGFAPAAEALHKSQSAISYAMNRLQDAVGAPLLQLHGRRAVLTPEGDALLKEAMPLIDAFLRLEQRAQGMARGDSLQIRILVDSMYPRARLFTAIGQLAQRYPLAAVHVQESVRIPFEAARVQDFDLTIVIAELGSWPTPLPMCNCCLWPASTTPWPACPLRCPTSRSTVTPAPTSGGRSLTMPSRAWRVAFGSWAPFTWPWRRFAAACATRGYRATSSTRICGSRSW